MTQTRKI